MLLCAAAGAQDGDVDLLVGSLDPGADGRVSKRSAGHQGTGRDTRRLHEAPTTDLGTVFHRIGLQNIWDQKQLASAILRLMPDNTLTPAGGAGQAH